jgi:hypothetical protein
MAGYSKLFSSIVTSTIWCEDNATLRVWIAMLAMCDAKGFVAGAVPGFASLSRVTIPEMRAALDTLSSPDQDSRSKVKEGRRIEIFDDGWQIVNYDEYRNRKQAKDGSRAPYERNRRAEKKAERDV